MEHVYHLQKSQNFSLNGDLIGDYHETHQRRKQKILATTNMVFLNEEPATQNHVRNAELAARNQCTNFCWTSKMLGNFMKKKILNLNVSFPFWLGFLRLKAYTFLMLPAGAFWAICWCIQKIVGASGHPFWNICIKLGLMSFLQMGVSENGGNPQNTPKWSFLVGKPMVVGYHHFRKPPNHVRRINFTKNFESPPTLVHVVHYWKLHSKRLNQSNIALPKTSLD